VFCHFRFRIFWEYIATRLKRSAELRVGWFSLSPECSRVLPSAVMTRLWISDCMGALRCVCRRIRCSWFVKFSSNCKLRLDLALQKTTAQIIGEPSGSNAAPSTRTHAAISPQLLVFPINFNHPCMTRERATKKGKKIKLFLYVLMNNWCIFLRDWYISWFILLNKLSDVNLIVK